MNLNVWKNNQHQIAINHQQVVTIHQVIVVVSKQQNQAQNYLKSLKTESYVFILFCNFKICYILKPINYKQ